MHKSHIILLQPGSAKCTSPPQPVSHILKSFDLASHPCIVLAHRDTICDAKELWRKIQVVYHSTCTGMGTRQQGEFCVEWKNYLRMAQNRKIVPVVEANKKGRPRKEVTLTRASELSVHSSCYKPVLSSHSVMKKTWVHLCSAYPTKRCIFYTVATYVWLLFGRTAIFSGCKLQTGKYGS